ncbi:transcriptional activator FOSB/c-Fos [Moesziomyces antarcticus T-34]|uniref:Transcriptional activator FOSB/c-Fos n=1 Tax=Pseudozyma antarctica (strain T-34) TaxID=1151754 RepID=M9LUY6_PSEA3|nr:transcriptional activator FOSB/c-Fos [Moesziomyces antarcticus T-34]
MSPDQIQAELSRLFCPPLDTTLVAAIAYEPNQTLQSAKEVCETLAAAAVPDTAPASPTRSESPVTKPRAESPAPRTGVSSRRKAFGGKLTNSEHPPSNAASTSSSSKSTSPAASSPPDADIRDAHDPTEVAAVERLLNEWTLVDSASQDPLNLHLTDEEAGSDAEAGRSESTQPRDAFDALSFLQHAFPSRTPTFLRETLDDSHGDVQTAVDTLMTIDLIEAEDALPTPASASAPRSGRGLDYEALAAGLGSHPDDPDAQLRGKKHRAARKRLQHEQRAARAAGKLTVNLTDLRHGTASSNTVLKKLAATPPSHMSRTASPAPQLTDAQLAAQLAAEEEAATRDPDADRPVSDNQWLLTSSVLAQLSTLLDVPSARVTSVYNASSFNLAVCFARLLGLEAEQYPSLASLDEAGGAPSGTAHQIAQGIAVIADVDTDTASEALRATKGRQDAAIDLLQLHALVQQQVGCADPLDPMRRLQQLGGAEVPKTAEAPAKGYAVDAAANSGKFAASFPTISQAAGSKAPAGSGVYSSVVGRKAAGPTSGAAAALRSGSAIASVLPASSAIVVPADEFADDPVAAEPSAWKQRGGVRTGGKGGDGGRGGIAWHYADEARRLDAKARAWSLRASHALVADRRTASIGVVRPGVASTPQNAAQYSIDLHGVNVHEALSIVREHVTKWYASPRTGLNPAPFKIVTGVGRHSPHQIAVLRPAIAKMLDREGWRHDVDHQRGIITVRGAK